MRSQCERHHKIRTKSKHSMSEEISVKEIDHVNPWLFDRINLDTNIQVKYVDTKSHLADILTIGTFTRDEWAHRLQFFNLTNISLFHRSHFSNLIDESSQMLKRQSEQEGERDVRGVAKSLPMRNLVPLVPPSSS